MTKDLNGSGGDAYEVGYRKPPKKCQFQKGKSGNPKGRPKGSKNREVVLPDKKFRNIILDAGRDEIDVNGLTGPTKMTMVEANIKSLAIKGAKGDVRAQKLFLELHHKAEQDEAKENQDWFETLVEYKRDGQKVLDHCKRTGTPEPSDLPHPNDIYIIPRMGLAAIIGPTSEIEVDDWEFMRTYLQDLNDEMDAHIQSRDFDEPWDPDGEWFQELSRIGKLRFKIVCEMLVKMQIYPGDFGSRMEFKPFILPD